MAGESLCAWDRRFLVRRDVSGWLGCTLSGVDIEEMFGTSFTSNDRDFLLCWVCLHLMASMLHS
jgi:hypothetical protein